MVVLCCMLCAVVFLASRRRHTRCAFVTGVQTFALPIWTSSAATAPPKRPRPRTRIGSPGCGASATAFPRSREGSLRWWVRSANDRPLFWMAVQALSLPQHEGGEQGRRADAPEQHQPDDDQLGRRGEQRRYAGGEPNCAQRIGRAHV